MCGADNIDLETTEVGTELIGIEFCKHIPRGQESFASFFNLYWC